MGETLALGTGEQLIHIPLALISLRAARVSSEQNKGTVILVKGVDPFNRSPEPKHLARIFNSIGLSTISLDLLAWEERAIESASGHLWFDIQLLARRLILATEWIIKNITEARAKIGYFGGNSTAAVTLVAAAKCPSKIGAVVTFNGRVEFALSSLPTVKAPALFILGNDDFSAIATTQLALDIIPAAKKLAIIPGSTGVFNDTAPQQELVWLAADWFASYLTSRRFVSNARKT